MRTWPSWQLLEIYEEVGRNPDDVPETILFKHLDAVEFEGYLLPLKIVATNLDTRELEVFDSLETGDVEVGEAVAASIAIPVIFEPVTMRSHKNGLFADGGLVSNLPIWLEDHAHDDERVAGDR